MDYVYSLERKELSRIRSVLYNEVCNWASEASPTLGCSIEISRDIYMYICCRYVVCRMSVVCQINCVGGITYGPRACSKSFFLAVKPVTPPCYSFPIRLSFSMDEKEAEARPVMGTIFLVTSYVIGITLHKC